MNSSTIPVAPAGADNNNNLRAMPKFPKWMRTIDQTEHAHFIIDAWLTLDPNSRDAFLAQLIAATIHDGPGSALERFAGTGILDAEAALAELNDVTVPIEREPWLDALGRYIITAGKRS
ncbi:hypothetical protein [Agromyces atrinae]|uniref:Uncharacterized protein n=1 Tax=Agromyces atrinae TaxID=592376 RepID=A0A4Q2M5Z5_9MICO|nr:hypothetical protein [Agromyces atrinae]NYD66396.1 hypothetical protein [Agromyces atrinae]RXZ86707.1 hypothetical protein ESP50_10015 [Agromyces atrinae]